MCVATLSMITIQLHVPYSCICNVASVIMGITRSNVVCLCFFLFSLQTTHTVCDSFFVSFWYVGMRCAGPALQVSLSKETCGRFLEGFLRKRF